MKKYYCFLLLGIGLFPIQISAQTKLPTELHKTFKLKGDYFSETIEFIVPPESEELRVSSRGANENGRVKVTIYNPKGRKVCALGLDAGNGKAKGNLSEATDDPMPGVWKIKITNKNSVGKISVTVTQN